MKYKHLVLISIIFPLIVFAQGQYSKIGNVIIYSEYYPNPDAIFKGTIVFENGSNEELIEWTKNKEFFECAKQFGSLFMYDHNGLGKSPADLSTSYTNPITAKQINDKLIKLLKKQHINPPYILVAHSYGGLYCEYFARKYPNLVRGILMIDPVPNNFNFTKKIMEEAGPLIKFAQNKSNKEVYTKYSYTNATKYKTVPIPAEVIYHMIGFEQTKKQINKLPPLDENIPVIILSSSAIEKAYSTTGDWYEKQQQWLNNNLNSKIIRVEGSHMIHRDHPELVCKQIKTLVNLSN